MDACFLRHNELPDLTIERLGSPEIISPLEKVNYHFVEDNEKILIYSRLEDMEPDRRPDAKLPAFEIAGPRRKIFFDPHKLNCGIVTCGGLCPGINDVIRAISLGLLWQYGIKNVFGFRYGYSGLSSRPYKEPLLITPEIVDEIHHRGGSILASSRGPQDSGEMVDTLHKMNISILFTIGGDGTLKGAADIVKEIKRRKLQISVIGVPKTIDNDICGIERTFGYSTAVEAARPAILAAHEEAKGAWNGIGLVKLMGRDSGFIAAHAVLANSDANFCFIPEVPLVLEGEDGFLNRLEKRLENKHHAVIIVAEGAGQNLMGDNPGIASKDASGNTQLKDAGVFLKNKINEYFEKKNKQVAVKYIDPSYTIRSLTANSEDSSFCLILGQNAVHAGMSGRTNMVVGYWNQHFTHIPVSLAVHERKRIKTDSLLWQTVLLMNA